ncbi:NAD(P)H-hydrate dehydratase [bacterium]|nr:NAD(P)H-hydrate dehydratase [bacterium]
MDCKLPQRQENSNKSTFGRVLNIAGSDYMPGAAYLSSVSALKIGCGYCFLASTERVINAVAAQTQNIVFVPLKNIPEQMKQTDIIEIGCGLSQNKEACQIFDTFLENIEQDKKVLIDADGLNILSKNYEPFSEKQLKNVILTPHPKEAARLLGVNLEYVLSDLEKSAKLITEKYHCTTVLKTHKTFVCAPDGRKYMNNTGNNALAKAGSGDVLAGMISGLMAQGMDLFEGACLGVYLHGLCADLAREKLTEYSVMAEDLISFIPNAIKYYLNINRI